VVVALGGLGSHFEAKGTVERGEIGEPVRLKERVGFNVAVFDLVHWTKPARGVAECDVHP
jgi:hypothetical protein